MATSKSASRTYAGDYAVVFDAVCRAAPDAGLEPATADPATGLITLSSSVSLASWGENITIQVGQVQDAAVAASRPPPTPNVAAPAAAWHPDPSGRHEHRYWDGQTWTDQVSDAGEVTTDPL